MKWIKAGDYVPNEPDLKQWRSSETKEPALWHQIKRIAVSEDRSDEVEWLDESEESGLNFISGFEIKVVKNYTVQKGTAVLMVHPDVLEAQAKTNTNDMSLNDEPSAP